MEGKEVYRKQLVDLVLDLDKENMIKKPIYTIYTTPTGCNADDPQDVDNVGLRNFTF